MTVYAEAGSKGYETSASGARLLVRLASYTDHIELQGGRVVVRSMVETPYNEFGIVDVRELFRRVLGSVASDYHWEGSYTGPHHVMWPKDNYRRSGANHPAMLFRGCATLRIILPRVLHDYTHRITDPPTLPTPDVMQQYYREQCQVQRLYETVRFHGLHDIDYMSHKEKEALRLERFREKLDKMEDGSLGVMPDRAVLAAMTLHEARQTVRSIARVRGLSNDRACRAAFFGEVANSTAA